MFHTSDFAVYSVAVYLGLLLGGAVIAPPNAWTHDGPAHPAPLAVPTSHPGHAHDAHNATDEPHAATPPRSPRQDAGEDESEVRSRYPS